MFEAVKIGTGIFDSGAFAEALVYYNKVHLLATKGTLVELVQHFGFDNTKRCVELGLLDLIFERKIYGVQTSANPIPKHRFVVTELAKTREGRRIESVYDDIDQLFLQKFGKSEDISRQVRWLADNVKQQELPKKVFSELKDDIYKLDWRTASLKAVLAELVPEYRLPEPLKFDPIDLGETFSIATNLDFKEINRHYHQRISPAHSTVTTAYILSHMFDAKRATYLAAHDASDIWVDTAISNVMVAQITGLLDKTKARKREVQLFHEIEFDGYAFKEVINDRLRTPAELVSLLEEENTIKFKKWLISQDPSANLIKEYNKAVLSPSGLTSSIKFKAGKILAFAGIGAVLDASIGTMGLGSLSGAAIGALADITLSSGDEFMLGKLLKGWKPNQFIEGSAKEFASRGQFPMRSPS